MMAMITASVPSPKKQDVSAAANSNPSSGDRSLMPKNRQHPGSVRGDSVDTIPLPPPGDLSPGQTPVHRQSGSAQHLLHGQRSGREDPADEASRLRRGHRLHPQPSAGDGPTVTYDRVFRGRRSACTVVHFNGPR